MTFARPQPPPSDRYADLTARGRVLASNGETDGATRAAVNAAPPRRMTSAPGRAHQQYQRAQVETASPIRLTIMLFEGAIRFCTLGREAMTKGDLETQNINLIKAQRIVTELSASLDHETDRALTDNLNRVYVFMLEQLVLANLHDDPARVEVALTHLRDLRDTWAEAERMTAQSAPSVDAPRLENRHV